MDDHSELKKLAEDCGNLNWRFQQENWTEYAIRDDHGYIATMRVGSPKQAGPDPDREAKAKFLGAMTPVAVLGLIAENDRLSAQARLAGVAAEMAAHDTAGRAVTEYLVVAQERDQLKAEIAGLKTGYEAYERVNAELKAEVEGLRKYGEEFAVLAERRREEADALRKDSESYRLLSFCHGQGTLELVRSHHELCAEIRRLKILAGEPVPPTPEEFIGPSPEGPTARIRRKLAAKGKGEQP